MVDFGFLELNSISPTPAPSIATMATALPVSDVAGGGVVVVTVITLVAETPSPQLFDAVNCTV